MHETPWYEFPFGKAFNGLWSTTEPEHKLRHWERRLALSGEYGVKAGYAGLLGWASGASSDGAACCGNAYWTEGDEHDDDCSPGPNQFGVHCPRGHNQCQ